MLIMIAGRAHRWASTFGDTILFLPAAVFLLVVHYGYMFTHSTLLVVHHIYIYIYTHTYIHTYIHVHLYIYIYNIKHLYLSLSIYIHLYTHYR